MNSRKFTALVLALALLAVPVLSLGETAPQSFADQAYEAGRSVKTTVTFIPGDMLTQDPTLAPAADLLKALKIEALGQKQGETVLEKVELFLQDKSSLDLTGLMQNGEFHYLSNLLGEQVLSFTPEEFAQLYVTVMETAMEEVPGFDAQSLETMKSSIVSSIKAAMENPKKLETGVDLASFGDAAGLDADSLKKDLVDPMTAWYEGVMAKPEVTTGTFAGENHDDAVTQKVYSISAEQLKAALDIFSAWGTKEENLDWFMKQAATSGSEGAYTKDELREGFEALPEEFAKESGSFLQKPITITELLDAKGEVKAAEFKAEIVDESASAPDSKVSILAGKYVKTEADGVTTLYSLNVGGTGNAVAASFTSKEIPEAADGGATVTATSWLLAGSVTEDGEETVGFALGFDGKNTKSAEATQDDWKLDISVNASGMPLSAGLVGAEKSALSGTDFTTEGTVDVSVMGAPALTIAYTCASGEPAALPKIPADSARLGKMTLKELEGWGEEASSVALAQLMGLMANLPPSVLELINGSGE